MIVAHGCHIFKLPNDVPWGLYAPPPFDVWLDEPRSIGHYHFLDTHMNVHLMPKDNNIVLKVQLGAKGDITRVLKVPPTTLVSEVCRQLAQRYAAVQDVADWGLIGKEKGAPVRLLFVGCLLLFVVCCFLCVVCCLLFAVVVVFLVMFVSRLVLQSR